MRAGRIDHGSSPPHEGAAPLPSRRAGGGETAGPRRAAPPDPAPGRDAVTDGHHCFPPPFKMAATEPALLVTCPQDGFPAVPPREGRRPRLHNGKGLGRSAPALPPLPEVGLGPRLRPPNGRAACRRVPPAAAGPERPSGPAPRRGRGRGSAGPAPRRRASARGAVPALNAADPAAIQPGELCRKALPPAGLSREGLWCARFTENVNHKRSSVLRSC